MATVGVGFWTGTGGLTELPLTDDDLLWAGRAAVGETGSHAGQIAVLWAWLQLAAERWEAGHRCVPCRGQPCRPFTYRWIVGCHSQPINEYWRFRGDNQPRRQMLAAASWEKLEQLSPGIKGRVYAWARNEHPNPIPGLADFSAPGQPDVPPGATVIGGNAFFVEGRSRSRVVQIRPHTDAPSSAKWVIGVSIAVFLTAVVVATMRA